jgi:hypothetical protein
VNRVFRVIRQDGTQRFFLLTEPDLQLGTDGAPVRRAEDAKVIQLSAAYPRQPRPWGDV